MDRDIAEVGGRRKPRGHKSLCGNSAHGDPAWEGRWGMDRRKWACKVLKSERIGGILSADMPR